MMGDWDDTWDVLADVVRRLRYKPGFQFAFSPNDRRKGRLRIYALTDNSIREGEKRNTQHEFLVPRATYDELNWTRWVFEQVKKVELHEAAEFFRLDEERVFAPHHGNGNDPYFEWYTVPDRSERVKKSPGDD